MRLGQLARKHDIPVQDILSYLEEETGEKFHPNAKLYDAIEAKIYAHFDLYPINPVAPEQKEEQQEVSTAKEEVLAENELSPADDIASVEGDLEIPEEVKPEETPEKSTPQVKAIDEDETIQTDRLLEMLESEESPKNLEKIKLIKAPKKELAGLKVLGKVDLPEPKKKTEPEKKEETQQAKRSNGRRQLSEEEREKRRLKAKRKKEAFEARQEKRRKEQEARRLKELKASHYKQKLQKTEVKNQKKKVIKASTPIEKKEEERPRPKTWLGRWWRWMNT